MVKGHIVAIGGGGFLTDSEPGLDQYIVDQCQGSNPKIGYIGTAMGDSDRSLMQFYARFRSLKCQPSHLPLFDRTPDILDWTQEQDAIYVGGGNTKSMLAVWRAWALPSFLKRAMEGGTILAGVSAGAICWFDSGVTDSNSGVLAPMGCLGFIEGSCCPHYSLDIYRKPAYERLVGTGEIAGGFAIDDGAAVHFIDGKPSSLVAGRHGASSCKVLLGSMGVIVRPIESAEVIDVFL